MSDATLIPLLPPKEPMTGNPYLDRYNYGQQQIIRDALERIKENGNDE